MPTRLSFGIRVAATASILLSAPQNAAHAQIMAERKLNDAVEVLQTFTQGENTSIPEELLQRSRGIAVIPNVFRGGFILGGRRGRGVLVVRDENNGWSNPAFVTLTGGSVGWQLGAESTDLVLVFANDNSVKNMASGKFTLGGDASAIAGPLGRHATLAVTFRAEVYSYIRSRGLFAGAAFEGARLDIDEAAASLFYVASATARPLGAQTASTPSSARRFLLELERIAPSHPLGEATKAPAETTETFPLRD
jgi:lipid-binding SYLF domain-containing protein